MNAVPDERVGWAILVVLYAARKAELPNGGSLPLRTVNEIANAMGLLKSDEILEMTRMRLVRGGKGESASFLATGLGLIPAGPPSPGKPNQ